MKIQEILDKYSIKAGNFYPSGSNPRKDEEKRLDNIFKTWPHGYPRADDLIDPTYKFVKNKWYLYTDKNFAGFNISLAPKIWFVILDEILDFCKSKCPEFKILNINVKHGQLKVQLSGITDEIQQELDILSENLYDERLA